MKSLVFCLLSVFALSASASLNVSPTFVNFGLTVINQQALPRTVGIQNTTNAPIDLLVIATGCPADFGTDYLICNRRISPREVCTIQAQFKPTAHGARTCIWQVHDGLGTLINVNLSGTGIAGRGAEEGRDLELGEDGAAPVAEPTEL